MIKVESIDIVEFRGIRHLSLEMHGDSFVVVGPNGSGKSGIVDAIDFVLTGNIARLSGEGTGGISVAKHAPHVHQRDNPAAASVTMRFTHTESGQTGSLSRNVRKPGQFSLDPDTPELASAVSWATQHPELILSRREVIKYVNTESGKRAQEIQALLKLDRIDDTRRLLITARNKTSATAKSAQDAVVAAEDSMRRILDVSSLLETEVTLAVNNLRGTLGLQLLDNVELTTELNSGANTDVESRKFNKSVASRDVQALIDYVTNHGDLDQASGDLAEALAELDADPTVVDALKHRQLIEAGLPLVEDSLCPLCDSQWPDAEALRQHLTTKLARSETAAQLQQRVRTAGDKVLRQLRSARALINAAQPHAVAMDHSSLQSTLQGWSNDLATFEGKLSSFESTQEESERLAVNPLNSPLQFAAEASSLKDAIAAVPDQSERESAQTTLTVAQDRWAQLRQARRKAASTGAAHRTATAVYRDYNSAADGALTALYETVERDFSFFYQQINWEDESAFKANLSPTAGKLELEVDFYGLGMFPPLAYHSEGHQDGMGVCLYLALIRQTLKSNFRLAVLDDVVTSVDANHRRQFCKLLKEQFPDVQFIMTTHDEVWARQMQSSGLIARRSLCRFHGWTVDGGPLYGQGDDFWEKIGADLAAGDVPGAAHKLRRNLESSLKDVTANIKGQVTFQPDGNYDLSTFFSAVKGRHGELLRKAMASANSWGNESAKEEVVRLKAERSAAILAQDGENWAINALVHNNDWASMTKSDFAPVVDATKQFLNLFTCRNDICDGWIYVLGVPGNEEELRCSCGTLNLNLRKK